jgi:hypothetical protein
MTTSHYYDQKSLLWPQAITMTTSHYYDQKSLLWPQAITMTTSHYFLVIVMACGHSNGLWLPPFSVFKFILWNVWVHWKISVQLYHTLKNICPIIPHIEKYLSNYTQHWNKSHYYDHKQLLWPQAITMTKSHYYDHKPLLWPQAITMTTSHYYDQKKKYKAKRQTTIYKTLHRKLKIDHTIRLNIHC